MKKLNITPNLLVLILLPVVLHAQTVPAKFNYQVSIRDNGNPISDREVSFRISILENPNSISPAYKEEHRNILTKSGICSFVIGEGTNKMNSIETISFQSKSYHIKVEVDVNNGTQYEHLVTSPLVSVPYAMVASQLSQNNATNGQVLKWDGTKWRPDSDLTSGTSANLSGDVSGSPTNNKVEKIQNRPISSTTPSNGQVLKWDGSQWRPDSDLTSGTSANLSGDVTGSPTNNKVEKIQNRPISSTTPSNGQVLKWDGSMWRPDSDLTGSGSNFWTGNSTTINNSPTSTAVLIGTTTYPAYNPKLLVRGTAAFLNTNNFLYGYLSHDNNNGQFTLNSPNSIYSPALGYFENTGGAFVGIANNNTELLDMGMLRDVSNNRFTVTANIKSFIEPHPRTEDKLIMYACIEGPEAAAYERGTIKLENGKAIVKFSEHFGLIVNPNTMTVNITPLSKYSKGLAVTSKTNDGIIIEELYDGAGNYEIDWEVKAVRKGYENFQVIRDKSEFKIARKNELK